MVDETEETGENHQPGSSYWQTLSHNVVSRKTSHDRDSNSQLSYDHDHNGPFNYDMI